MTAAGKEEEVGGAAAFRGQSATPAVRRRVALADAHTTLAAYCPDMYDRPVSS